MEVRVTSPPGAEQCRSKTNEGACARKTYKAAFILCGTLYLTSPATDRGISVRELFINVPLRQIESNRETVYSPPFALPPALLAG